MNFVFPIEFKHQIYINLFLFCPRPIYIMMHHWCWFLWRSPTLKALKVWWVDFDSNSFFSYTCLHQCVCMCDDTFYFYLKNYEIFSTLFIQICKYPKLVCPKPHIFWNNVFHTTHSNSQTLYSADDEICFSYFYIYVQENQSKFFSNNFNKSKTFSPDAQFFL